MNKTETNAKAKTAVINCQKLCKRYQQGNHTLTVLNELNFQIASGERVAIIGASGSGKTTLLNLLGGIDQASSGQVFIQGKDIASLASAEQDNVRNQTLGFVYQFHHLLGEFSALENVAMPLVIAGLDYQQCLDKAQALLEKVGLKDRLTHKPSALSGGERQRVAIARALVNDPACVLMDEPTGNLDKHTADDVHELMQQLNQESHISFIIVTHDEKLAHQMDRVMMLQEGKLIPFEEAQHG